MSSCHMLVILVILSISILSSFPTFQMNNSLPRCMQGITLVPCGNRMFRVSTASIPDKALSGNPFSKQKSITLTKRSMSFTNQNKRTKGDSASIIIKLSIPRIFHGHIIGIFMVIGDPLSFDFFLQFEKNDFEIGAKGHRINKLKLDTNTSIRAIPENDEIEIEGRKTDVDKAKTKIEQVVEKNKTLVPPSHFLSLPLSDSSVQHKVENFQNDILSLKLPNIDPSIMNKPTTLHITIGMLNLYRQEDIDGAVKLLKSLDKEINELVGARTLSVKLSGIKIMENDLAQANVLYSEVKDQKDQDVITKLNEFLVPKFTTAGYMKNEDYPLKIHATIINTSHRKTEGNDDENKPYKQNYRKMERKPFSAVQILNKFSNIDFGISRIEEIHISKIGAYDEKGRHRSEGKHKLP